MKMKWCAAGCLLLLASAAAQTNTPNNPSWWNKYQYLSAHGSAASGATSSTMVGVNVDVSNECGPQSETYITLNTNKPKNLAGGSNEIFRDPMRAYASFDGGLSWAGSDVPLPQPLNGTNDSRFGSDPSLAFDSLGNLFYSYIVVFFGGGNGVDGSEMAVARSDDGGKSFPSSSATYFSFSGGSDHFNDKPMITVDTNSSSPFRDTIYVAWDAASGGSSAGGIRVGRSFDHGKTFAVTRADDLSGPGKSIGAVPFVGPNGELYVAWNDYSARSIIINSSTDGGVTWGTPAVVSQNTLSFEDAVPAISFRGALLYPSCDADRTHGPHRGRLYCAWMDVTSANVTDIYAMYSDNGTTWFGREAITDQLPSPVDRFYPWLSVDQTDGSVNVSFYDTRNDMSGNRYLADVYFTQSTDGGVNWRLPNTRVSSVSSNEHDCGAFPCPFIDYGNQYGDYTGLVSYGGVSHPIWTDSRNNFQPTATKGCSKPFDMEEVFTAAVH